MSISRRLPRMTNLRPKARAFDVANRLPLVSETARPVDVRGARLVRHSPAAAVAFPGVIFPRHHDARSHVLQVAGGLLVILGAYFTAVTIREIPRTAGIRSSGEGFGSARRGSSSQ